jgi:TPR repeat protein
MGRAELAAIENGSMGEASGDMFFRLGMMYSIGADIPTDYVTAHKWFNLAAMRGIADAARLRREIAEEMSETEIAAAQRAARDWLRH